MGTISIKSLYVQVGTVSRRHGNSSHDLLLSFYSKETLLYKEDLKRHLNTETGSTNLSYFIHGSDNVNQELGDEDSEIAKHEIMKVSMSKN